MILTLSAMIDGLREHLLPASGVSVIRSWSPGLYHGVWPGVPTGHPGRMYHG
ncbi:MULTISPECIES: hypothetical protein [Protofrankia]|uniref:hypothetical protein n=1 Tax=Protofrankia TaxID=2994361 RepID=UPI0001C53883|nr:MULTISPECIES: hypothetical protein [Protofrankia]